MQRHWSHRIAVMVAVLGLLSSVAAFAAPPKVGQTVQGNIISIDVKNEAKRLTLRQDDGGTVDVKLGPNTSVTLEDEAKNSGIVDPSINSLKVGMLIRTQFQGGNYAKSIELIRVK
jgi:hypothetical protein